MDSQSLIPPLFITVFFILSLSFLILLLIRRNKGIKIDYSEFDEKDLMILEAIKRGYKTLSEISDFTKISKSTVYRRLKKLHERGYVSYSRISGTVYYELNLKKNETTKEEKREKGRKED
ncbi:MAG: winged helix-turn-helix domain-containing protein [Sulfolobus sp.]